MTLSAPAGRRATKCLVPGASAAYLFNEGAGTTLRDHSGNGRDGTVAGAAFGAAGLAFDGTDDWVDVSATAPAIQGLTAMTLQVVATATTSTPHTGLVGPAWSGAGRDLVALMDNSNAAAPADSVWCGVYDDAGSFTGVILPGKLTATPKMITLRYIGGTVLEARSNLGTWTQTTTGVAPHLRSNVAPPALYIGYRAGVSLTGSMYALFVYPAALTDAQIAQNYAAIQGILAARGVTIP